MGLARIWVHRRHVRYPEVDTGWQHVRVNIARFLISQECAQGWQTDGRQVKPISNEPPKGSRRRKPKAEPAAVKVDEAAEPTEGSGPYTYNRRDIRAED